MRIGFAGSLLGALNFGESFFPSRQRQQEPGVAQAGARVVGVQLQGPMVFLFGPFPFPIIVMADDCQGGVGLGEDSGLVRESELHGYGGLYGRGLTIDEVGFVTPPAHGVHGGE